MDVLQERQWREGGSGVAGVVVCAVGVLILVDGG